MKAAQATTIAKNEIQSRRLMTLEELEAFESDLDKLSKMVDEEGNKLIDDATIEKLREAAAFGMEDGTLLSGNLHKLLGDVETEYSESLDGLREKWNESMGIVSEDTTKSFEELIEEVINIAGEQEQWTETGASMIEGLNKGIIDKSSSLYACIQTVMLEAVNAAKESIDSHSPSRVFAKLGQFMDMGLVVGLKNYASKVTSATSDVGEQAISSMKDVVSNAYALINSDADFQPTICPVLDLSNVRSGSRTIGELMSLGSSIGVNANVGAISSMMSNRRQNGTNDDIISELHRLNDRIGSTGNSYTINGVQYNEGSDVAEAFDTILRAARIERRI